MPRDNDNTDNIPTGVNPYNLKAGGSRRVGGTTYRIEPKYKRHDYNDPWDADCRCDQLMEGGAHADCFIWGRGWASADYPEGAMLKDKLKDGTMEVSLLGAAPDIMRNNPASECLSSGGETRGSGGPLRIPSGSLRRGTKSTPARHYMLFVL